MKRVAAVWGLLLCLLWAQPVWAASWQDDANSAQSDEIRSYSNLETVRWSAAAQMPAADQTLLHIKPGAGAQTGSALYRVSGAQDVQVRIITQYGTFFTEPYGSPEFGYMFMWPDLSRAQQLQFDPSDGTVWALSDSGSWRVTTDPFGNLAFESAAPPPVGRLVAFGVNVYAVLEGGGEVRLNMTRHATGYGTGNTVYYTEEVFALDGAVPAGTQWLRVELNDLNTALLNGRAERTSLAGVTLSGSNLVVGPPTEPGDGDGDGDGNGDGNGGGDENTGQGSGGSGSGSTRGSRSGGATTVYHYYMNGDGGAGGLAVAGREWDEEFEAVLASLSSENGVVLSPVGDGAAEDAEKDEAPGDGAPATPGRETAAGALVYDLMPASASAARKLDARYYAYAGAGVLLVVFGLLPKEKKCDDPPPD